MSDKLEFNIGGIYTNNVPMIAEKDVKIVYGNDLVTIYRDDTIVFTTKLINKCDSMEINVSNYEEESGDE